MFSRRWLSFGCLVLTVFGQASVTHCAWGDESFLLKNGGKLDASWLNPKRQPADAYELKTAGIRLVVGKDQIAKVLVKSEAEIKYEKILEKLPPTVEGNWKMAEWCKEHNLKSQREFHLQTVLNLDPAHEGARLGLGYQRFDGVWQKPEDRMASLGYQKFQGRWVTPQELAILQRGATTDDAVVAWRKKIRLWKSWLGNKKRDGEARNNFRAIRDPLAATALNELLLDTDLPRDVRVLALDALVELPGRPGEANFIQLGVEDADEVIRNKCLEALEKYDSKRALFRFIALLKSEKNLLVNRAAQGLALLRNEQAVPALIEALTTSHEVVVVPGQSGGGSLGPISGSFSADGNNNGGGFSFGAPPPKKMKRELQNDAVLGALTATVPGVNYGFDKAAWKKWLLDREEPEAVNLRRAP